MAKMVVEFEWNDELGPLWMNLDNLKLLLYGQMYTKPELLNVTLLDHSSKSITLVRGLGSEENE